MVWHSITLVRFRLVRLGAGRNHLVGFRECPECDPSFKPNLHPSQQFVTTLSVQVICRWFYSSFYLQSLCIPPQHLYSLSLDVPRVVRQSSDDWQAQASELWTWVIIHTVNFLSPVWNKVEWFWVLVSVSYMFDLDNRSETEQNKSRCACTENESCWCAAVLTVSGTSQCPPS